jgi:hypothetical protein
MDSDPTQTPATPNRSSFAPPEPREALTLEQAYADGLADDADPSEMVVIGGGPKPEVEEQGIRSSEAMLGIQDWPKKGENAFFQGEDGIVIKSPIDRFDEQTGQPVFKVGDKEITVTRWAIGPEAQEALRRRFEIEAVGEQAISDVAPTTAEFGDNAGIAPMPPADPSAESILPTGRYVPVGEIPIDTQMITDPAQIRALKDASRERRDTETARLAEEQARLAKEARIVEIDPTKPDTRSFEERWSGNY